MQGGCGEPTKGTGWRSWVDGGAGPGSREPQHSVQLDVEPVSPLSLWPPGALRPLSQGRIAAGRAAPPGGRLPLRAALEAPESAALQTSPSWWS